MTTETDVAARLAQALRRSLLVTAGTAPDIAAALLPVVLAYGDQRAAEAKAEVWSLAASWVGTPFDAEFRARAAALRGEAGRG